MFLIQCRNEAGRYRSDAFQRSSFFQIVTLEEAISQAKELDEMGNDVRIVDSRTLRVVMGLKKIREYRQGE